MLELNTKVNTDYIASSMLTINSVFILRKSVNCSVVTVLDRQNSVGFGRYYGKNRGFGFGFENCH